MKIFIENLKKHIEKRGLSSTQFSVICGFESYLIDLFLECKKHPTPSQIAQIAKSMQISFENLLYKQVEIPKDFECKLFAIDVDGVMTDGGMYVTSDQKEMKKFNTHDGIALKAAKRKNIEVGFISNGLMNSLIAYRAAMVHVDRCYVGNDKKLPILESWCNELRIGLENVAYIGDDINDLEIISSVGLSACPANAVPAIKAEANIILNKSGGQGCVREFGEMLGWIKL